jgi:IS1 family transposase
MNRLSTDERIAVISALVEGNSILSVCRMLGHSKNTVAKLLLEIGAACDRLHDERVRNVKAERIQCDEIWSFVGCKQRRVEKAKRADSIGDVWTWVALDADTKLAVSYLVAGHDGVAAYAFMHDLVSRLANRVQLTTDAMPRYREAVENTFGWDQVDYAQLIKLYGEPVNPDARYSPAKVIGIKKEWIMGQPKPEHVSTSFVERQDLTMRMQMRRFTRLTNAFSKKLANHTAAVSLHFVHYNFCRAHQTLTKANRGVYKTPAMAAGLADRVWTVADIVGLLDSQVELAA